MNDLERELLERVVRLEEANRDQANDIAELKREREGNREWARGPRILALAAAASLIFNIIQTIH